MKVTCLGAARTVTGSCFLVEASDRQRFLVDCGMYQGGRQIEMRNRSTTAYRVSDLKAVFLTHAHIDHSGLVPRLVRQGFRGPVYATEATCDLLSVLWLDAAHIQEMESEWQTRKNKRKGRKGLEPLYETADAESAINLLKPVEIDQELTPFSGVAARFVTAGHILGAASLHLSLNGPDGDHRVGFSGDLGRPGQLIVPDPEPLPPVDTLFMETTYGSRRHKSLTDSINELHEIVRQAYREGGKVLIPAFAVERTQEIIYILARAYEQGEIPREMPVYLDSPLAINATVIFRQHPDFFDEQTQQLLLEGKTPMNLPNLKFTPTTEASRALNTYNSPAVIIAGSGMANAGRIKHHLKHNLWRPNCHVVIVGFQAQGTTGRKLVDGAEKVKIFREEVAVKAKVHTIGGFSAHADQEELLLWLERLVHPDLTVNLVHGEESAILTFQELAGKRFPQVNFHAPNWREALPLAPTAVPEAFVRDERTEILLRRLLNVEKRLSAFTSLSEGQILTLERVLNEAEKSVGQSS